MIFLLQPPSNLQLFLQSFTNKTTHLQKNQDPNVKNTTGLCLLHTILFKPLSLLFFIVHTQGQKSPVIGSWPCLPDGKKRTKTCNLLHGRCPHVHTTQLLLPNVCSSIQTWEAIKIPTTNLLLSDSQFPIACCKTSLWSNWLWVIENQSYTFCFPPFTSLSDWLSRSRSCYSSTYLASLCGW